MVLAWRPTTPSGSADLLAEARRCGFRRFLVEPAEERAGEEWYREREGRIVGGSSTDQPPRPVLMVRSPAELDAAVARVHAGERIAVRFEGEWVLPLERLVGEAAGADQVWFWTDRLGAVPSGLGALEHGAGSVVLTVNSGQEIARLRTLVDSDPPVVTPELAQITRVESGGPGDRVLIDTTSLLEPDEGLWVGSTAELLFHLRSESVGSRYTRPRPFRINAGGPHAYTLLASGETRYLSELRPGEAVLVGRPDGRSRAARVGRLKIERRPLVLAEAECAGTRGNLFVQEAETVRLSVPGGAVAATELHPGIDIVCARFAPARHLGRVVSERVEER